MSGGIPSSSSCNHLSALVPRVAPGSEPPSPEPTGGAGAPSELHHHRGRFHVLVECSPSCMGGATIKVTRTRKVVSGPQTFVASLDDTTRLASAAAAAAAEEKLPPRTELARLTIPDTLPNDTHIPVLKALQKAIKSSTFNYNDENHVYVWARATFTLLKLPSCDFRTFLSHAHFYISCHLKLTELSERKELLASFETHDALFIQFKRDVRNRIIVCSCPISIYQWVLSCVHDHMISPEHFFLSYAVARKWAYEENIETIILHALSEGLLNRTIDPTTREEIEAWLDAKFTELLCPEEKRMPITMSVVNYLEVYNEHLALAKANRETITTAAGHSVPFTLRLQSFKEDATEMHRADSPTFPPPKEETAPAKPT